MRLAQESRPEGISRLYIYSDQGSYEPLARVDKAGKEGPNRILYFHTDVNGAPEEMTDSDGKIVWETGYQVWGKIFGIMYHLVISVFYLNFNVWRLKTTT
ncbi:RHS domain-containing protein [Escherichia marmotae]|nr:RHS domain-containing protein [Escherichia marmotae]